MEFQNEQRIMSEAIEVYSPRHVVILFSGGYDSMIAAYVTKQLDTHGIPVSTWSINTMLSADGWLAYVQSVADELKLPDFNIWHNEKGFEQFKEFVRLTGCPRTRAGHTHAYRRLKERAIAGMHMLYKRERRDKTLFVSGMRRAESAARQNADEHHKPEKSNLCFVAPIVHWSDEQVARFRIENDFPTNPFYDTVRGSGDCQCNWGNFISLGTLQRYSPELAAGNVAIVDQLSREATGVGWDGSIEAQLPLFDVQECELEGEFLCSNCSRGGDKHRIAEKVYAQRYF